MKRTASPHSSVHSAASSAAYSPPTLRGMKPQWTSDQSLRSPIFHLICSENILRRRCCHITNLPHFKREQELSSVTLKHVGNQCCHMIYNWLIVLTEDCLESGFSWLNIFPFSIKTFEHVDFQFYMKPFSLVILVLTIRETQRPFHRFISIVSIKTIFNIQHNTTPLIWCHRVQNNSNEK